MITVEIETSKEIVEVENELFSLLTKFEQTVVIVESDKTD